MLGLLYFTSFIRKNDLNNLLGLDRLLLDENPGLAKKETINFDETQQPNLNNNFEEIFSFKYKNSIYTLIKSALILTKIVIVSSFFVWLPELKIIFIPLNLNLSK